MKPSNELLESARAYANSGDAMGGIRAENGEAVAFELQLQQLLGLETSRTYADWIKFLKATFHPELLTEKLAFLSSLLKIEANDLSKQLGIAPQEGADFRRDGTNGVVPVLTPASSVEPVQLQWAWRNRFPLGKLSLIVGDPGLGKSLLTVYIASHITTGALFFDGTMPEVGDVIMVSAEDDPADTLRPRLDAAGADVNHVFFPEGIIRKTQKGESRKDFSPVNVEHLEAAVQHLRAKGGKVVAVIIDPLSAYLDGVDSHSNAEVRSLLRPLSEVAAKHSFALIGVMHLNKSMAQMIYRVTGSLAFVAAARAVWLVARGRNDRDERIMVPIKSNLSSDGEGLRFHVAGESNSAPVLHWDGTIDRDDISSLFDETATTRKGALGEAQEFLEGLLSRGPLAAKELLQQAERSGISERSLRRALAAMGIKPRKTNECWLYPKLDLKSTDVLPETLEHEPPIQEMPEDDPLFDESGESESTYDDQLGEVESLDHLGHLDRVGAPEISGWRA